MSYQGVKAVALVVIIFYVLFGLYENYVTHHERYPVFSWSLFSEIPNGGTEYTIAFHRVGNTTFEEPLFADDAAYLFNERGDAITAHTYNIRKAGAALAENDPEHAQQFLDLIEAVFADTSIRYSIYQFSYNPLDLYLYDTREGLQTVGTFDTSL